MKYSPVFLFVLLTTCIAGPAAAASVVAELRTDKARYSPGAPVTITITLTPDRNRAVTGGRVGLSCYHLDTLLSGGPIPQSFRLVAGRPVTLRFRWQPPRADYQGYLVEARVRDTAGKVQETRTTAVDVSSTWTRFPRYGFLAEYPAPDKARSQDVAGQLADFHLNGLQFYDWQYKHHRPLAGSVAQPAASWKDIANRTVYRQTILDQIDAAHGYGMAAMNYNLIYGAWSDYESDGVDPGWGLEDTPARTHQDGLSMPDGWATPTIFLFNPGNTDWQHYLFSQEAGVFAVYPFDGWHVDQVGDRGLKYAAASGAPVDVWTTFRPFLNKAKKALNKAVVFNNVGGYGLYDTAANSTEDAVYVECWEPAQKTYNDLKTLIEQCASWSKGKGVILAAYMNKVYGDRFSSARRGSFNAPGVLLTDAAIFASGGAHIELGDDTQLLDSEYFPNHNLAISPSLKASLRRYYDFLVAYENLLRGGLHGSAGAISLRLPASGDGSPNTVWTFAKVGEGCHVVHLLNLLGERSNDWRDTNADYPAPTPQTNVIVKYYVGAGTVQSVSWASPDRESGALAALPFTRGSDGGGAYVQFTLPSLTCWDMVYLRL